MRMISADKYKRIVERMPVLCVDVIVQNTKGQYLLVRRVNEPLKGKWWVIGGRVLKGETLEQAAKRKVKEESGLAVGCVHPVGYYEGNFRTNPFGVSLLHCVSIVFLVVINNHKDIKLDYQSSGWKYSKDLPRSFVVKLFAEKNRRI